MRKVYDVLKEMLVNKPELRNSDKKLAWEFWSKQGAIKNGFLSKEDFLSGAENYETIRRCRQKIQETYPELVGNRDRSSNHEPVEYKKEVPIFDNTNNTVRFI